MGYRIAANRLRTVQIFSAREESLTVKTLSFRDRKCAAAVPGQFLMLWVPRVDEIPFSVLADGDGDLVSVAVRNVGEATRALHEMRVGDVVGVRGPFGNGFTMSGGRVVMVGGGTGVVPLLFLARRIVSRVDELVFLVGAECRSELLFLADLERIVRDRKRGRLVVSTEDGSCGIRGLCTEPLEDVLGKGGFDVVYTCGPEAMMMKVFEVAEKFGVRVEASLERLMRCAIGLCGSCVVGRYRVCVDGPVFASERLMEIKGEFGVWKRDFDGRKVKV